MRIVERRDLDLVILESLDRLSHRRLAFVVGLGVLAGLDHRRLLFLAELAMKLFFDINTGSYIIQSALLPGAVRQLTS